MAERTTKAVRITRGRLNVFREALRHHPVQNLPEDSSDRLLTDAALEIAAGLLWCDLDHLPRVYRSLPRFTSRDGKADTVDFPDPQLVFYSDGPGLAWLTGGRIVEADPND